MNDGDLNLLMRQLLVAQAYWCGSPVNKILVNTEGNAKDDGCDGWSAAPATGDQWLGSADTCWQFKAGSKGEPARLSGEVIKPIPKNTLVKGGRFAVVSSASNSGKKGEDDRLNKLTREASAANIPVPLIEVIGSERLATWCNQRRGVAACWVGGPLGLWTLDDWSNSPEHQVSWQASEKAQSALDAGRAGLDFATDRIYHLHIQGAPGVGKTRFALELCRGATWSSEVIYFRQASDARLSELIDVIATDLGATLVVVADEVQPDQLRPLCDSVERGRGRIRLITIGHTDSPDARRIPAVSIEPLKPERMRNLIKGWYPAMPPEHVDFVLRFSDGYVRLALLAGDAVMKDPTIDVRELVSRNEISTILNRMLGEVDRRRGLHVVAVLTRVGWDGGKEEEGKIIAAHFDLDWNEVRAEVEMFHSKFRIAPYGGLYRCISPRPLGIYLANEAYRSYPGLFNSLPGVLPSEEARNAYHEQRDLMFSNPQGLK